MVLLYYCTYVPMYLSRYDCDSLGLMGKKRLVIDLTETEHQRLVRDARKVGLTLSNYVRKTLNIPLRQQGVPYPETPNGSKGSTVRGRRLGT